MRYLDLMKARAVLANGFVASFLAMAALADSSRLDDLFAQLKGASDEEAVNISEDIWMEWSKSGSAAVDLLLRRGEHALAMGDLPAAIDHATAAIDNAPDFAEAYNLRATAFFQMGEYGLSLGDIGRVLALNPRHFGALAGFGMILEELGRKDQALEVYRAALALHPHLHGVLDGVERLEAEIAGREL